MSWSVTAIGKPAVLKPYLAKQFATAKENCKNVPHEVEAIGFVEQLVNNQIDFYASINQPTQGLSVKASGSAYRHEYTPPGGALQVTGSSNVTVTVENAYGLVDSSDVAAG